VDKTELNLPIKPANIIRCYTNKVYLRGLKNEYTALPGVMMYIFSGQDARTTRVS